MRKNRTDYRKVVILAKDMLKQLRAKTLKPIVGNIVGLRTTALVSPFDRGPEVQEALASRPCEVCWKGAALIAKIRRFDSVNGHEFSLSTRTNTNTHEYIPEFPEEILHEAEILYEQKGFGMLFEYDMTLEGSEGELELADYSRRNLPKTRSKRMAAICRLLIKNKGRKIVLGTKAFRKWQA